MNQVSTPLAEPGVLSKVSPRWGVGPTRKRRPSFTTKGPMSDLILTRTAKLYLKSMENIKFKEGSGALHPIPYIFNF